MAHIKERMTILLTLAAFSLSFLCCRDLDSVPAVYVGVNSLRANIVITVMYYAGDDHACDFNINLSEYLTCIDIKCTRSLTTRSIRLSFAVCFMRWHVG